jgi:hypothetical protein
MRASVWFGARLIQSAEISALVVRRDQSLCLIPDGGPPLDLSSDRWTRVCVDRVDSSPSVEEPSQTVRRAIAWNDDLLGQRE